MTASRVVSRVVGAVVLAAVLVGFSVVYSVWEVARQDNRRPSDAIVVLGSAQYNGRPSPILEARLDHALALYQDGIAPRIVTVGGARPGDRFSEAEAGQDWLQKQGVPASALLAVGTGSNTLQSMQAVGKTFAEHGWRTAVLVSDPPHTLRATAMARDSGIDAVGSPTRQGPAVETRKTQVRYILRESLALVYYRLFGGSDESGPSIG